MLPVNLELVILVLFTLSIVISFSLDSDKCLNCTKNAGEYFDMRGMDSGICVYNNSDAEPEGIIEFHTEDPMSCYLENSIFSSQKSSFETFKDVLMMSLFASFMILAFILVTMTAYKIFIWGPSTQRRPRAAPTPRSRPNGHQSAQEMRQLNA